MNDTKFQNTLKTLLDDIASMDAEDLAQFDMPQSLACIKNVRTFQEAQVLTNNAGLVIEMTDGSEFQITIVKSR